MSITRVDYRERQRLTAEDLRAEQDYRRAALGRHLVGPHDWGVVLGLHVTGASLDELEVWPGLAIDGYGREIVVPRRVVIDDLDGDGCWSVLLYACDVPAQVSPGRRCEDDPAPRTAEGFAIRAVKDWTPPEDPRAARVGDRGVLRPWPVLLARVGSSCRQGQDEFAIDLSMTRYVRHRASMVQGPSGRATLQLGLRNREDVYHWLLSTRGPAGSGMEPRLGIDRDGAFHVWRPWFITGPEEQGTVQVSAQASVAVTLPTLAGIGASREMTAILDRRQVLQRRGAAVGVAMTDTRPGALPVLSNLTLVQGVSVANGAAGRRLVRSFVGPQATLDLVGPIAALFRANDPDLAPRRIQMALAKTGGRVWLQAPVTAALAAVRPACGEDPRSRTAAAAARPVMQLRPGSVAAADATTRAVQAVTVSAPTDLVPRTVLQLNGGAHDDSDGGTRISLGGDDHGAWKSAVEISGSGGVRLLGAAKETVLDVSNGGTTYLPPIGPNDPLLPELVLLAFTAGLPRLGSPTTITISLVSQTVPRGSEFTYKVKRTGNEPVRRCFEVMVGVTEPKDLAFRQIAGPTGHDVDVTTVIRHRSGSVDLLVVCLIEAGTKSRLDLAKTSLTIQ